MMKRFFACALLVLVVAHSYAQADSLLKVYQHASLFKAKMEAGNELVFIWRFDHRQEAKRIAFDLLQNKSIERFPEGHSRCWIRLGIVYDLSDKADSAIWCNEKGLAIANRHHLGKQKSSALNNLGLIYWHYNQLDKATKYITEASAAFETLGDTLNFANAINNLGLITRDIGDKDRAKKYHRQALKLFLAIHDEYGVGSALHNIALSQDNIDSARYYYYRAALRQKNIHDDYGLAMTYNNLAIVYSDPDSAMKYYTLALEHHQKAGNLYGQASSMGTLALTLLEQNQTDRALELALKSEKITQSIGDLKYLWKIEGNLGEIYWAKGDFKNAAIHFKLALDTKDTVLREEVFKTSQQLELKYHVAQKERQLIQQRAEIVQKQNTIIRAESEKKTIWLVLIVIIFAAVFAFLLLGWYLNRKRWHSERNHARLLNEEKERGLQQTLIAQEEERQRIAKDLHDGIVQDLAAIKMNLEQMRDHVSPSLEGSFENARNNLERTTKEVREISHQMMPTALRELGLQAAVEDALRKVLPLQGIKYDFFAHGLDERLPEKIEISLFRILQELINNIIKHSGANQVNVSITRHKHTLTMHVEDNGRGFDNQQKSNGIGLMNLQSRVNIVNGDIRYEAGEHNGTVVIVKVPL